MVTKSFTNPGVLGVIKDEHDEVKNLFKEFDRVIDRDKSRAKMISDEITTSLLAHTKLEEDIVYPTLKKQDESLFYEANEEHHVADVLINEIRQMSIEDPAYAAKMEVLRTNVEHHVEEEEDEMFDQLKKLDNDVLDQMAEQWKSMKPKQMQAAKH
jgi:hemerythrin superfamily protein